jgi:HlyD family secretion protein
MQFNWDMVKRNFSIYILSLLFVACSSKNTLHPQIKDIVETVYASGKIMGDGEYNLCSLAGGTIIRKLVRDGDHVAKGQVLFIIRSEAPAAKLEAAKSTYINASENAGGKSVVLDNLKLDMQSASLKFSNDSFQYVRLKNLYDQDIGTKSNLDLAYTTYRLSENQKRSAEQKFYATRNDLTVSVQNAKSQMVTARSDLANNYIRSEKEGTVYQTLKEEGDAIRSGDAVALLGPKNEIIIRLAVDQQDVNLVKTGQLVLFKTDVTGNTIHKATVRQIYPLMNESDQTFRVDAIPDQASSQSFIHASVEANILIRKSKSALVIPRSTLLEGDSVQILRNRKTLRVPVQTGVSSMEEIEITKGILTSDELIMPAK